MRNIKKFVAIILVLAFVLSFAIPTFAAAEGDAGVLEDLNILRGTGDGVTPEYVASAPTRYQAARMFLRVLGLEDEAIAYLGTANFPDVDGLNADNQAMLAYLKANPDLGFGGYPDGTFQPFKTITAPELYKVLLTALGYTQGVDFEWANVMGFAFSKGLTALFGMGEITIGDFATAVVEALKADDSKLAKALIVAGKLDGTKAAAHGIVGTITAIVVPEDVEVTIGGEAVLPETVSVTFADESVEDVAVTWGEVDTSVAGTFVIEGQLVGYDDTVDINVIVAYPALAVDSVSMTNLKEMVITFNRPVDATTGGNAANYTNGSAVSLSDDGMTATVTITTPVANGVATTVTIGVGVKDADGTALAAAYDATYTLIDATRPAVTGVALTSANTFNVTFSEPLATVPTVIMESGIYTVNVTGTVGTNTVAVTILATLTDGSYDLAISGAVDYAGLAMVADNTQTLVYVKDVTAPTLLSAAGTQSSVTLTFSEALASTLGVVNYYHSNLTAYNPNSAVVSGSTVVLTFTTNPLPEGSIPVSALVEAVTDMWGNKLAAKSTVNVEIAADLTAPAVTADSYAAGVLTLTLSEAVTTASALLDTNFTLINATSVAQAINQSYTGGTTTITLSTGGFAEGTYTGTVNGLVDLSLAANAQTVAYPFTFTIGDETAVTVDDLTVRGIDGTDELVYVDFGDDVDMTKDVLKASNYSIQATSGAAWVDLPSGSTVVAKDAKEVKITVKGGLTGFTTSSAGIRVGRVTDTSGNVSVGLFLEKMIATAATPTATATQANSTQLVLTFDGLVSGVSSTTFTMTVGGDVYAPAATIVGINGDGDKTTVTLTLTGVTVTALKAQNANYGVDTSTMFSEVTASSIVLNAGGALSDIGMPVVTTSSAIDTVDKTLATVVSDTYSTTSGIILITMSEAVTETNEAVMAVDLIVKDGDGVTLVPVTGYTTNVTGSVISIQVIVDADVSDYTVETIAAPAYLKGVDTNVITFGTQMQE